MGKERDWGTASEGRSTSVPIARNAPPRASQSRRASPGRPLRERKSSTCHRGFQSCASRTSCIPSPREPGIDVTRHRVSGVPVVAASMPASGRSRIPVTPLASATSCRRRQLIDSRVRAAALGGPSSTTTATSPAHPSPSSMAQRRSTSPRASAMMIRRGSTPSNDKPRAQGMPPWILAPRGHHKTSPSSRINRLTSAAVKPKPAASRTSGHASPITSCTRPRANPPPARRRSNAATPSGVTSAG